MVKVSQHVNLPPLLMAEFMRSLEEKIIAYKQAASSEIT